MGETKIIVVANQKGGVGKSTMCMLLANYLTSKKDMTVGAIIDTDSQQSIVSARKEDELTLEATGMAPLYQVVSFPLDNIQKIPSFVDTLRNNSLGDDDWEHKPITYIIDTPGSLDSDGVAAFISLADFIICPFDYTKLTLTATNKFIVWWNKLKIKIRQTSGYEVKTQLILIPCQKPKNVGTKEEKTLWDEIARSYQQLGYHTGPEIGLFSSLRKCSTTEITPKQLEVSHEALEFIYDIIYNSNNN